MVTAENEKKDISFNFKINAELAGFADKEIRKKTQLRFIDSCSFIVSSLDKLASNLDDDKHIIEFYTRDDFFKLIRHKRDIHMSI